MVNCPLHHAPQQDACFYQSHQEFLATLHQLAISNFANIDIRLHSGVREGHATVAGSCDTQV